MSAAPYMPVEIVEQILSYTDGRTLFRCSMVCTTWKNVFERLSRVNFFFLTPLINLIRIPEFCVIFNKICSEQKNELWKRLCFDEFEMDEMSEMLSELYPFTRMINYYNDPDINWFIVYRNCKSSRLTNPCEQTSTIEINARSHINRTINCMKLSGMFVLKIALQNSIKICDQGTVSSLATLTVAYMWWTAVDLSDT
jgi:F-box-like